MELGRVSVKYFLEDPAALDVEQLIPTFHEWIRGSKVDGLLLDVSDYRHVPGGPGIMLVGHECDYRMDLGGSRPGLCYVNKQRGNGTPIDPAACLRSSFRGALVACRALERERSLSGLRFASDEVELQFLDRRRTPNDKTAREALTAPLAEFVSGLVRPAPAELDWDGHDPRRPLSVRLKSPGAPDLDKLIARLD